MLLAVAVKVTGVPGHMVADGTAAIVTEGVRFGFTAMVIILEVAVLEVKQVPQVTVISQETVLPLIRVAEV